ncbi:DinB family protein [Planctomonas psychrotolerans]|uniref:DinB family protein n=1 Tax=Planctomonas psychrotolerans TaxID=2528712 RepID=UPI00123BDCE1|nr:DinB family protein [Planctomonas psychrotolerans]
MDVDTRPEPPNSGDERAILVGFLEFLRATVVVKASGLSDDDARRRLLPSLTTVAGLIRHLADVERTWFREVVDGQTTVVTRWSAEDPDGEFRVGPDDTLAGVLADYESACAESREVIARYRPDDACTGGSGSHDVRWVLVHMIEETGRHCGHLDILREMLDGRTGE